MNEDDVTRRTIKCVSVHILVTGSQRSRFLISTFYSCTEHKTMFDYTNRRAPNFIIGFNCMNIRNLYIQKRRLLNVSSGTLIFTGVHTWYPINVKRGITTQYYAMT